MEVLEYFYENRPSNAIYYPRKLRLPIRGDIYLYGAAGTGKTALLLEYIDSLDINTLYIDCEDPTFILNDIDIDILNEFIAQESIDMLVLDHWYDGFLDRRPDIDRVILSSRYYQPSISIKESLMLHPLDYEEFMGFGKAGSAETLFNRFLKLGTLPQIVAGKKVDAMLNLRSLFFERFSEQESRLLPILARFQAKRVNAHQIYTAAKEYFKISKDWTYKTLKKFEKEGVIIFIDDLDGGRRMFIYDFALTRYLNHRQPFAITFDTMVALALYKHGKDFIAIGRVGYILPKEKEFIIPAPFETQEVVKKKITKIKKRLQEVKRVAVVTVSSQYIIEIDDLTIEAMPFYEWSILND